jgi:hypothetical protein
MYTSASQGACSTHESDEKCIQDRRRWEDNIRIDLKEIVWECVDWMHLAEDRNNWQDLLNFRIP